MFRTLGIAAVFFAALGCASSAKAALTVEIFLLSDPGDSFGTMADYAYSGSGSVSYSTPSISLSSGGTLNLNGFLEQIIDGLVNEVSASLTATLSGGSSVADAVYIGYRITSTGNLSPVVENWLDQELDFSVNPGSGSGSGGVGVGGEIVSSSTTEYTYGELPKLVYINGPYTIVNEFVVTVAKSSGTTTSGTVTATSTLTVTSTPEPASLAIWSVLGVVGAAGAYRARRKANAAV